MKTLLPDGRELDYSELQVMAIVNITPDSFFDGGKYMESSRPDFKAVSLFVEKCLQNGINIFDIGGESSRPGAKPVPAAEEIRRAVPVIEFLRREFPSAVLSIDTYKLETARQAADAGADIINDISAGEASGDQMFELAVRYKTPLVLMHKQGNPETMQDAPHYEDVLLDVGTYLASRLKAYREAGGSETKAIFDPGIGFGKTKQHNMELLRNLGQLPASRVPLLIGASHKRLITDLIGAAAHQRQNGTIGLHIAAAAGGAQIVRLHEPVAFKEAWLCFAAACSCGRAEIRGKSIDKFLNH